MVNRTDLGLIIEPNKPTNIPTSSQWLAGQGAGSWFNLEATKKNNTFSIRRFDPNGIEEFKAEFIKEDDIEFCLEKPFKFTYLSHYQFCHLIQNSVIIRFNNKNNDKAL